MLQPNFNLPESVYHDISNNITEITQVGWRMNFLNNLEDFEDCIETTSNLLEFCLQSVKNPKIFNFVSTVAPTVPTYKVEYNGIIPETPTSDKITNLSGCTGYSLSKLVSEQICYQIAKTKNLPVNVFRFGELSGDQSLGQWNTKEFLPLLIRVIVKLNVYPNLGSKTISWVPIDLAAKSLADLGHFKTQNPELYTIVNPKKSDWRVILNHIQAHLNVKLQEVELGEFLSLLKSPSPGTSEVDISQGLSDFLESYLKDEGNIKISWDVSKTCERTEYLANCPPIDSNLISKYFNYWSQLGYFD
jgi:thioester reductase-like protein